MSEEAVNDQDEAASAAMEDHAARMKLAANAMVWEMPFELKTEDAERLWRAGMERFMRTALVDDPSSIPGGLVLASLLAETRRRLDIAVGKIEDRLWEDVIGEDSYTPGETRNIKHMHHATIKQAFDGVRGTLAADAMAALIFREMISNNRSRHFIVEKERLEARTEHLERILVEHGIEVPA